MHKLKTTINFLVENFFGYVGILMILIATYGVFARTVLEISSPWIEEALKLLFVWSIFTCAGLAFISKELISLDLINEKFSKNKKVTLILNIIQNLIGLIFGGLCVVWSIDIISVQFMTMEATTVLGIPLFIINIGFLLGNLIIVVSAIIHIFQSINNYKK